jgi:hypothetical protein
VTFKHPVLALLLCCLACVVGCISLSTGRKWAPAGVEATTGQPITELVSECRGNLRVSPRDAQRSCEEALEQIRRQRVPKAYISEKRQAQNLLSRIFFSMGRIEDAAAFSDSVHKSSPEPDDPLTRDSSTRTAEIDRLFATLRITLSDRIVPVLSYLKGIDIGIEYPSRLTPEQRARLEILEKSQWRADDEFQFVGLDSLGRPYIELEFFPLVTFPGARGYSLVVENRHRYRFNFEPGRSEALEIRWEEDAGWELVERVPGHQSKLEFPAGYEFEVTRGPEPLVLVDEGTKHSYVDVDSALVLKLTATPEQKKEQVYRTLLYTATVMTGVMAISGAR